ncbi:hypothetical protein, partial [Providencia sp. PROV046]|uniref:hypothetical protein n=1 Tax=Providencia sp. PROV046 TaxID=2949776 RepID=UPI00234A40EB
VLTLHGCIKLNLRTVCIQFQKTSHQDIFKMKCHRAHFNETSVMNRTITIRWGEYKRRTI